MQADGCDLRCYVCAGGGIADYEDLFVGVRRGTSVVFGVGYEAWIGFVPGSHACDGGNMGDCVVPVCDHHSIVCL